MNTMQTSIKATLGVATPGTVVEAIGTHSLLQTGKAADAFVVIGKFVFAGTSSGELVGRAAAATVPLGVVINNQYYTGSMANLGQTVPMGEGLSYLQLGVIAVNAPTTPPTVGQGVNVDPITGIITTGTATGGAVDTGWKVRQAAPANGVMFIVR